ncbi:MAG TPA: epimerase, partial [Candidatus Kapabacteria bacterium]|nr:epimerase [Candidatus Kapabacteria bacterium]
IATEGQRNVLKFYKYVSWLFPLVKVIAPGFVNSMQQVGQAMINAARFGYEKKVIEVRDITKLSSTVV